MKYAFYLLGLLMMSTVGASQEKIEECYNAKLHTYYDKLNNQPKPTETDEASTCPSLPEPMIDGVLGKVTASTGTQNEDWKDLAKQLRALYGFKFMEGPKGSLILALQERKSKRLVFSRNLSANGRNSFIVKALRKITQSNLDAIAKKQKLSIQEGLAIVKLALECSDITATR